MFEFVAALVDVAVNVPETKINECCAEDTGENEGDYEVGRCHGLKLPMSSRTQASQQFVSRGTAQVKQSKEERRHDFAFLPPSQTQSYRTNL